MVLRTTFPLGEVVITRGADKALNYKDVVVALQRHAIRDWGELDAEDVASNNHAVNNNGRLMSAYTSRAGVRFWIVTEASREVTTILLPEEY